MGFGVYTDSKWQPSSWEEAGEKNMKLSRFFMSQKKYMCEKDEAWDYGTYGEMQELRTPAVKSFHRN